MAITINSSPNTYQSFHEDLWFVVSSTNTAQTNFKYVFDVYINGTLVSRVKSFPQPSTGYGIFNAANIVRNYWSSYFYPTGSSFSYVGSDIRINYVVKYGEEYGGTLYTNLDETDTNAFNYYPNLLNGLSAYDGNWFENNYTYRLLTNRDPLNLTTRRTNGQCFVSLLNSSINTPINWNLDVTRYGNLTPSTVTGGNVSVSDYAMMDLSPASINTYLGTSFINSNTEYYLVEFNANGGAQFSTRVNIICEPRYTTIPIHFLNSLGGYDTINFSLVNKESRSFERKSFEQMDWQLSGDVMSRTDNFSRFNGGSVQFATAQTITYKLTSDWLNLTEYNWIKELIGSPEVYMQDTTNLYYIPVKISTSSWTEKKRYADKVYNLELDIEFGSKAYSQYR